MRGAGSLGGMGVGEGDGQSCLFLSSSVSFFLNELQWHHSSFARSLLIFFIFILRFWNQILTCLSVRLSSRATSYLRSLVRYMLNRNSFSSSSVWCLV